MTTKTLLAAATTTALAACGGTSASPGPTAATGPTLIARAAELDYRPCAPPLPAGCEIAVLEGNPAEPGPFTVRMRASGPVLVAPHSHPAASRVTVLSGTLHVGFQDTVDKAASVAFEAGDYYVNVGGTPHFVWTDGPMVLQLTGTGPWESTPVGDHAH